MHRQSGRRILALILAPLMILSALPASAAEGEPPVETKGYTYTYELRKSTDLEAGKTKFQLYVCGEGAVDGGAPLLHSGSIALGTSLYGVTAEMLTFAPESAYDIMAFAPEAGGAAERGTTPDGRPYLGFTWLVKETADALAGGEQLLGTLTLALPERQPEDLSLIPWAQTLTGRKLLGDIADEEARDVLVGSIWRMENTLEPSVGFYQGYYAEEDGSGETFHRTDIRGRWQAFQVSAYAPKNPITLYFYLSARAEDGSVTYPVNHTFRAELPAETGTGAFTTAIRFNTLSYKGYAGAPVKSFAPGAYKLVVSKQSHVEAAFTGLSLTRLDDGTYDFFPELSGMGILLPCGDVDGDGTVRQADLAGLLDLRYLGTEVPAGEKGSLRDRLDLDGDGKLRQSDLAILIAPANYGQKAKSVDLSPADGGEET